MTRGNFHKPPTDRRRGGFSLIEILVTISIIVLLIGITIAVGAKMKDSGKSAAARTLLGSVMTIDTEYEIKTNGKHIDHADTALIANPVDVPNRSIERYVVAAKKYSSTREALSRLPKESVGDIDSNGYDDIIDPWGTKLVYVSQAAVGNPDTGFLPPQPFPFVASAGPDKTWGNANAGAGTADFKASQDNLYSFKLD